jgi:hypothetical protein
MPLDNAMGSWMVPCILTSIAAAAAALTLNSSNAANSNAGKPLPLHRWFVLTLPSNLDWYVVVQAAAPARVALGKSGKKICCSCPDTKRIR